MDEARRREIERRLKNNEITMEDNDDFKIAMRIDINKKENEELRRKPWNISQGKKQGESMKRMFGSESTRGYKKIKRKRSMI